MIRALSTAATGLKAQQTNIDIVANNLANINTSGYKKVRAEFRDIAYELIKEEQSEDGQYLNKTEVGLGVELSGTSRIFSQGSFIQTSNPLDMAIDGDGFFKVRDFDGTTKYTRDGSFKIDSEGKVVTSSGRALEPEIVIPKGARDISVSQNGTVTAVLPGESAPVEIGKIEIAVFPNPSGLKAIGSNMYEASSASGEPEVSQPLTNGAGGVRQGFIEGSNVEVVDEMVRMLSAQRAFEINSKAMEAADDMLRTVNNIKVWFLFFYYLLSFMEKINVILLNLI